MEHLDGLISEALALTENVPHLISNLANVSALLYEKLPCINWVGFYIAEGKKLVLGPFQGRPACIEIPFGKGVCGTAAERKESVLVPDVHEFPGHIACDGRSRSELVIPVFAGASLFGVLDVDSPEKGRFTEEDKKALEKLVSLLEKNIF